MKSLRVFLTTALCAATAMLPMPAQAAGEHCARSESVKRCAEMITVETDDTRLYAQGSVESLRYPRVKVRMARVVMQHQTDDGWVAVATHDLTTSEWFRGHSATAFRACAGAPRGLYRSRVKVEWKVRGQAGVRSDTVTGRGVRKSRLC